MSPLDRLPAAYVAAQWRYIAGARGPWSAFWRRILAAWRCAAVARLHVRRAHAWRAVRAAHRQYMRACSTCSE